MPGALHTHTGWHKRKENIDAGLYDLLGHHLKVRGFSDTLCRASCVLANLKLTKCCTCDAGNA